MSAASIILAGSGPEEQDALEAAGYRLFFAPGADALRHVLRAELGDLLLVPADTPRAELPSMALTVSLCRANLPVVVVGEAAFGPADPPRALSVIEAPAVARRLVGLIEDRLDALQAPRAAARGRAGLGESVAAHLERYFDAHAPGLPAPGIHGRIVREVERPLISLALGATGGNQLRAAALLGLNRNTLRKKIRELDIEVVRGIR